MKTPRHLRILFATLAAAVPLAASAQTTFFSDTFNNGSTIASPTPVKPTADSTSYEQISAKTWSPNPPTVSPNDLRFGIASTSSGVSEIQALFATSPVPLTQVGDYIQMVITYTNVSGLLTTNCFMGFGLYNSGQVFPMTGMTNSLTSSSNNAALGGAQNWQGYVAEVAFTNSKSQIMTRAAQTGTDNRNQDLVTSGSSSQSYGNPPAVTVGSSITSPLILSAQATCTEVLNIAFVSATSLAITNSFYSGPDTSGTLLTQFGGIASGTNVVTAGFDALAMGWYQKASSPSNTVDISSIQITGQSTAVTAPPIITSQPVAVTVPSGAACDFNVSATGFGLTYQWHRHGTNLVDAGNISGAKSSMLVISPASAADVESGANGYYVTITGTGNFSTNSVTNSLTLGTARNLEWTAANSDVWDLNTTANWQLSGTSTGETFNFGDNVTFDDFAGGGSVDLSGSFLSAGTVTVNSQYTYTLESTDGTGSFAGPGSLLYEGSGQLTLNVANTYTGGTVISNANAHVYLENYAGLGTGPITLALAGGQIETVKTGSSTVGITGDIIVNDDFTLNVDGSGSFGTVLLGDLSGVSGKTLTVNTGAGSTSRVRAYGENTVYNADLNLASPEILWAPYSSSGSQTYNGVISGPGAVMQKGSISYFNGQNTYSGGVNISAGAIGLGVDSQGGADANVTSGPIGTGPLLLTVDSTTTATGNGEVIAVGGAHTIGNSIQYPSGTNNLTMTVGGANDLTFSGTFTLNGNDFINSSTIITRTIQVTNTAGTTFAGAIVDNSSVGYGLIKTGSGALYLDAANTYTGGTTNNSGTTNTPGLLAGSGSIAGPVFVQTNSSIGGGSAASIGTLTISNNLTIAGNGWFRLNKSSAQQSDEVSVTGTLANTGTGTITVTNLGPALAVGDTFTLFSQPVANGSAMTVTGGGMVWTNKLALNGSIQALSVAPTTANYPTNVTFHVSGSTLTIGWPATHLGWILQQQTNTLKVGLTAGSNTWFDLAGSSSSTNASITINPANPTVFFRLRHP